MQSRFDTEARIAVAQAADIARELGHTEVGPDHLLLGLLANARGTAYAALTDHGLRLDAARDIVAAQHVDAVDETDDRRRRRRGRPTRGHVVRRGPRGPPRHRHRPRPRPRRGPDQPRRRPHRRLGLPVRARPCAERDRRGGRGRHGRGRHHHRHHDHEGRGRRGPRSRRGDGPRFSRELRGLLRDVRRSVLRRPARRRPRRPARGPRHDRRAAAGRADPVRGPGRAGRARRTPPTSTVCGPRRRPRPPAPPSDPHHHDRPGDPSGRSERPATAAPGVRRRPGGLYSDRWSSRRPDRHRHQPTRSRSWVASTGVSPSSPEPHEGSGSASPPASPRRAPRSRSSTSTPTRPPRPPAACR